MIVDDVLGNLKQRLFKGSENDLLRFLLLGMFVMLFVFIICGIITHGRSIYNTLWFQHDAYFSDYFDSIQYAMDDPYSKWHVIYPGIAMFFYLVIGYFISPFMPTSYTSVSQGLTNSQMGLMSYFLVCAITIFVLFCVIKKVLSKDKSVKLLLLTLLLSFPVIQSIERGNCILIPIILVILFVMGYDSENKKVRYLAYVALGIAAGFKLYVALFGLLLLRRGDKREIVPCIIIGIIAVIVPTLLMGGSIIDVIAKANDFASLTSGTRQGIYNLGDLFSLMVDDANVSNTLTLIWAVVLTAIVALFLWDSKKSLWADLMLISGLVILGFGVGTPYIYTYLLIPLIFFVKEEKTMTTINMMLMSCFIVVFCTIPCPVTEFYNVMIDIKTLAVAILFCTVFAIKIKSSITLDKGRV